MKSKRIIATLCLAGVICTSWVNIFEWKTFSIPGGQVEIITPVELKNKNLPLPAELKEKLESSLMYSASIGDYFMIGINEIKYKIPDPASLEETVNGTINGMKNNPDYTDLSFTKKATTVSGHPAILLKGSYTSRNVLKAGLLSMIIDKKSTKGLLNVIVIYDRTNNDQVENATKVIQSIKVKTN